MFSGNSMNFVKNFPSRYILLLIVFFAFLLRVNNLTIGFPMLYISNDEAIFHLSVLNMLAERTPFTLGNYGPLGAYIQLPLILLAFLVLLVGGVVDSVREMEVLLVTQEGYLIFVPRVISAMFGTLVVLAVYKLSLILFGDKKSALWASFLTAASFNLVHISHLARSWSAAIFFCMVATIFAIKSIKSDKNEMRNTILAFSFAAVSYGFHQISGTVVLLVILIRYFGIRLLAYSAIKTNLVGILVWAGLVVIFTYLSLGLNFLDVVSGGHNLTLFRYPKNSQNAVDFVLQIIANSKHLEIGRDLLLTDGLIVFLAMFFLLTKKGQVLTFKPFLIFLIISFAFSVFLLHPFLRYLLVAIAFLPVFAGRTIVLGLERLQKINFVLPVAVAIVALVSFNSIYWNLLILREPTFDQLRNWVDQNISPQTPIAVFSRRNTGYVPIASASELVRKFRPGYYVRSAGLIGDSYSENVRNVMYFDAFPQESKLEQYQAATAIYPVDWVIDSYYSSSDRLINQANLALAMVAHFSPTGDIVQDKRIPEPMFEAGYNFPLFVVDRVGPYFDVLRVK